MDSRATQLIKQGDYLFSKRMSLTSLWQEIADNFYVERADFTVTRSLGQDFASHLTTSFPMIARRDLGNAYSSILRPANKQWFAVHTTDQRRETNNAQRWLEMATDRMRQLMYSRKTQFVRSTKEADHDFATFGQCVISIEKNADHTGLLYRTWHLRDVAWCENEEGAVNEIYRNWNPTAIELNRIFKGKVHENVKKLLEKDPYTVIKCRHAVVPVDLYPGTSDNPKKYGKYPYVSVYIDIQNQFILEETPRFELGYIVPRWQTVSGSQYAYSPATVAALPDARLIQAMTLTLLEAGEKATNPPLVAVQDAIRSDVSVYAGGITWVDSEYDERLGEVLRPLTIDKTGLPTGFNMQQDIREIISEAFFLNKLNMPPTTDRTTAYEASIRYQEYIRNILPLFEPMEMEYNGALCENTFNILMRSGAFGPMDEIPAELRGADIQFRFESPLTDTIGKDKGQKFLEAKAALSEAAQLDPTAAAMLDAKTALRDVLSGISTPASWVRSKEEMAEIQEQAQQQQNAQQQMASLQQGGIVAEQMGKAATAMSEANATAATQA